MAVYAGAECATKFAKCPVMAKEASDRAQWRQLEWPWEASEFTGFFDYSYRAAEVC